MGWINRTRDTRFRDITSLIQVEVISGRLLVRRKGDKVTVIFDDLVLAEAGTNVTFPRLPVGLRPLFRGRAHWFSLGSYTGTGVANVSALGYFNVYMVGAGAAMSMRMEFDVAGTFPNDLPGEEASL